MNAPTQVIPFIPSDFKVPEILETKEFRLRMLTVNDVVMDYDAVMSSVDHCKTIWPGGKWPEGLTLEQNLSLERSTIGMPPSPLKSNVMNIGRF